MELSTFDSDEQVDDEDSYDLTEYDDLSLTGLTELSTEGVTLVHL